MKPRWKHECTGCEFLFSHPHTTVSGEQEAVDHYDWYICRTDVCGPTYLCKYGDRPEEYWSIPVWDFELRLERGTLRSGYYFHDMVRVVACVLEVRERGAKPIAVPSHNREWGPMQDRAQARAQEAMWVLMEHGFTASKQMQHVIEYQFRKVYMEAARREAGR